MSHHPNSIAALLAVNEDGERKGRVSRDLIEARKQAFLICLSIHGNIAKACREVGISRSCHHDWRKDPDFQARFLDAQQDAADGLEEVARRRAEGFEEVVIGKDGVIWARNADGSFKLDDNFEPMPLMKTIYSDLLMARMLEAKKPEYRTKSVEMSGPGGQPLPTKIKVVFVDSDGNGRPLQYDTAVEMLEAERAKEQAIDAEVVEVVEHEFDPLED